MEKNKRILIVEDDADQRQLLVKWINEMDESYLSFSAATDTEALALALEMKFDLIIMDIDLKSELNGFEIALKLREYPKYQLTWIVFLTVETAFELRAYRETHCYAFLDKPYPKASLQSLIRKLLVAPITPNHLEPDKYLVVEADQVTIRIRRDEIIFLEAKGRGSLIYTIRGNYEIPYTSLKQLEKALEDFVEFFKAHRSYVINTHFVKAINRLGMKQYEVAFYNSEDKSLLSRQNREALEQIIGGRRG